MTAIGASELDARLARELRDVAHPLEAAAADYDPLLELIGEARVVLLGEASHGTHEFYRERAQITKRLIEERGFHAVAHAESADDGAETGPIDGKGGDPMLIELSIVPLGGDTHLSEEIAGVLELVDASGLAYQLTPCGTCIEGEWDEVMPLVRSCHERARRTSSHVFTTIRIEDEAGGRDKLTRNVTSIEEKVGRTLMRTRPE